MRPLRLLLVALTLGGVSASVVRAQETAAPPSLLVSPSIETPPPAPFSPFPEAPAGTAPAAAVADPNAAPAPSFLPTPVATAAMPAGSAAPPGSPAAEAYGAFQRGYYLSAMRLAEPLANLGDPAAQTLLGEIYARGLGVPRDEKEAARWYGIAAKAGVAEAQFRYALMLIDGRAVERDDAAARDLMKAAADAGNPLAAFNYGQMLIQSSPTGGFAEALGYFRKAAGSGVPDAEYALSQLYAYGRGTERADDGEARRWLTEAARSGHDTAQIELGIWLINGRGGAADPREGFRWLKGAAERGNPIAVNRVAHLYKDGIGIAADRLEAGKWVVLARRAANSDAALDGWFRSLPDGDQKAALEAANRFRSG
ncbi:tetratricopeptide repeat protein [Aureimonas sp. AU12]|uniref:tetratricopeptide repeat protein n=1 Tax=Aureimonas sp. AU12 TaxID=1638161 RepID=UPI0009E7B834|nr:tetratricopeptide repeat protein [Aureimonas sp. AU12]